MLRVQKRGTEAKCAEGGGEWSEGKRGGGGKEGGKGKGGACGRTEQTERKSVVSAEGLTDRSGYNSAEPKRSVETAEGSGAGRKGEEKGARGGKGGRTDGKELGGKLETNRG